MNCNKVKYQTHKEAAQFIISEIGVEHKLISFYYCEECNAFHTTSQKYPSQRKKKLLEVALEELELDKYEHDLKLFMMKNQQINPSKKRFWQQVRLFILDKII